MTDRTRAKEEHLARYRELGLDLNPDLRVSTDPNSDSEEERRDMEATSRVIDREFGMLALEDGHCDDVEGWGEPKVEGDPSSSSAAAAPPVGAAPQDDVADADAAEHNEKLGEWQSRHPGPFPHGAFSVGRGKFSNALCNASILSFFLPHRVGHF